MVKHTNINARIISESINTYIENIRQTCRMSCWSIMVSLKTCCGILAFTQLVHMSCYIIYIDFLLNKKKKKNKGHNIKAMSSHYKDEIDRTETWKETSLPLLYVVIEHQQLYQICMVLGAFFFKVNIFSGNFVEIVGEVNSNAI